MHSKLDWKIFEFVYIGTVDSDVTFNICIVVCAYKAFIVPNNNLTDLAHAINNLHLRTY